LLWHTTVVYDNFTQMTAHKLHLSVFPISNSPGRKLYRAHSLMRLGLTQAFRQAGFGITTEQWALLSCLWEHDRLTQLELGQHADKDRHIISRMIDSLEAGGLVRRRTSPLDRRIREVELTSKGRAVQAPLTRLVTSYLEEIFAGLSQVELGRFLATLEHIIARLEPRSAPFEATPSRRRGQAQRIQADRG
jgi:MarR family transcriptional regulator, organic hydroperoxide resistance regulator